MMTVAAYCRVSTDKQDQANSFSAQQRYFREYISREEDWQLFEIYADEGITGTSTKKRTQFNRMMDDAREGKFRLLLTKEVSRFARNTLDAILFTRELKKLGIGVLFMADGINTMDPDAELRLSILGSIAQEESRRTSQRVKWGQSRRMEQGIVFGHGLLGYNLKNGILTVEPVGAYLVQTIFRKYAEEKLSSCQIARDLSVSTGGNWSATRIIRILKNEKYVGDLVQKKTYTPDYLTHEKKKNQGAEPLIVLHDHHTPIVDRALWNAAQTELELRRRASIGKTICSYRYGLSGKIFCGSCGNQFIAKSKKRKNGTTTLYWQCKNSATCKVGKLLRDALAREAVSIALQTLFPDLSRIEDLCSNDLFIQLLVNQIIVHPDRHLELWLKSASHPIIFHFV